MTVPFAISVHSFVTSVGAYVGLGSIVAVALLVLLYFAHARETATLRERLDEAQQRIGGLEGRITQMMQTQASQRGRGPAPVVPGRVAPVPAPAGLRALNAPSGAVRRVPSPATAVAATGAPAGMRVAASKHGVSLLPAAPAGSGAPALASATKLIPEPALSGNPDDTLVVSAAAATATAAAVAADGKAAPSKAAPTVAAAPAPAPATAAASAPTKAASAPATATPAAPPPASAAAAPAATAAVADPTAAAAPTPAAVATSAAAAAGAAAPATAAGSAGAPPPRVQIGTEPAAAATGAAGGGGRIRRIGGHPQSGASLPAFDDDEPPAGGRLAGRVVPLVIGVVAVAVIIAGLIVITNTGNSTPGNAAGNNSAQTGQSLHKQQAKRVPFNPAHVTVAVLNGTAQSGLAGDVGRKLAADRYKKGNITNAASQTQRLSFVYYAAGPALKANRVAARKVAAVLTLPGSRVRKAGHSVLQSCAISVSGASLGSCKANVIVLIGQDRVPLATG